MSKGRFKLTMPEPSEVQIHEACARALDALLLPPAAWACYPAGHIRLAAAETARLTRAGLKRGWPDLLVIFEALVFGIEIKAKGGALSKTRTVRNRQGKLRIVEGQAEVFPRLERAGMHIIVVHSVDEMLTKLRQLGLPLRATVGQESMLSRVSHAA